jgi:hypothetical protein
LKQKLQYKLLLLLKLVKKKSNGCKKLRREKDVKLRKQQFKLKKKNVKLKKLKSKLKKKGWRLRRLRKKNKGY